MRELSLFSGAGGGLLGTKLLGWTHCGYVEYDDYCQRIIKQRIEDGLLDDAPIFGDIRAFIEEGYADSYSGMVDVVTGGFPCQPFSVAGKQAGADDPRNMWPATIDCIRRIQPKYAFLENVPGLISSGYFDTILGDLAESGYDAKWRVLSAAECGAPHKRDRLWIVATNVADAQQQRPQGGREERQATRPTGLRSGNGENENQGIRSDGGCWEVEPDVGRVAHGVAARVDRLRALGNGQVPAVVAKAWELLTRDN